jgi:hypothetical protein
MTVADHSLPTIREPMLGVLIQKPLKLDFGGLCDQFKCPCTQQLGQWICCLFLWL